MHMPLEDSLGLNLLAASDGRDRRSWLPIGAGALATLTVAGTANLHALVDETLDNVSRVHVDRT